MKHTGLLPLAGVDLGLTFEDAKVRLRQSREWEEICESLGLDEEPPPSVGRPDRARSPHAHDTDSGPYPPRRDKGNEHDGTYLEHTGRPAPLNSSRHPNHRRKE